MPPKPAIISAQLEGSGAADTEMLSIAKSLPPAKLVPLPMVSRSVPVVGRTKLPEIVVMTPASSGGLVMKAASCVNVLPPSSENEKVGSEGRFGPPQLLLQHTSA